MEWLKTFLDAVDLALAHGAGLSIGVGLVFALAGTQWVKFVLLSTNWLPDPKRWILKALALPMGTAATVITWPSNGPIALRVMIGLAVGFAAPYVYQAGTAVIYRLWPEAEKRLSANPYQDKAP